LHPKWLDWFSLSTRRSHGSACFCTAVALHVSPSQKTVCSGQKKNHDHGIAVGGTRELDISCRLTVHAQYQFWPVNLHDSQCQRSATASVSSALGRRQASQNPKPWMHTLHKVRSEPNDISSLKSSTDNTFGSKIARNFDGCHGRNSVLLSEEAQQFIGNMSFCNAQNGTCTECPQMALIRS